jgi:hypothetical protein
MTLTTSEQTDAIVPALFKAQGEIGKLTKDAQAYKYKYADLPAVLEAVKEPLRVNELFVVQSACTVETITGAGVVTRIYHSSGQWIESMLILPIGGLENGEYVPPGPQDCGSAITYARRHALMALLNLAAEDDDGQRAKPAPKKRARKPKEEPKKTTAKERAVALQTAVDNFKKKYGIGVTDIESFLGHPVEEGITGDEEKRLTDLWRKCGLAAEAGDDVRGPILEHLALTQTEIF